MSAPNHEQQLIAQLRLELKALESRLRALEERTGNEASAVEPARTPDEIVAILSAAVAAYLGCKPRIKAIRLVGSQGWAQQGRVSIQASHVARTWRK